VKKVLSSGSYSIPARASRAGAGDGGDQQGIVGQRRKKLRCHDDVENGTKYLGSGPAITLGEVYTTLRIGYKMLAPSSLMCIVSPLLRKTRRLCPAG
jgi:hypothetical protein